MLTEHGISSFADRRKGLFPRFRANAREVAVQRYPRPERVTPLSFDPSMAVFGKSQVEIVDDACQNDAHLDIGQAEWSRFVSDHVTHENKAGRRDYMGQIHTCGRCNFLGQH